MSINNVYIIGLPSITLNLFSNSTLAWYAYNSVNGILIRITNSSKINKDTTQMPYIYNTITLEVQQITTIFYVLYFWKFWMRSNQVLTKFKGLFGCCFQELLSVLENKKHWKCVWERGWFLFLVFFVFSRGHFLENKKKLFWLFSSLFKE